MNMVDCKMTEFALMGVEPKVENAIILVINDIVKSYAFMRMTDATLESIGDDILKECGSHISDLTLKPSTRIGMIRTMFRIAGRTIRVDYPVLENTGDYLRVCRSDPRTMMKMDNGMGIHAHRE